MASPKHDEAAALVLIKAVHAAGGRAMSKDEAAEFLAKRVWLGFPKPIKKLRGRKPKRYKTQYDEAHERRHGLFYRLTGLPQLRRGGGYIDHEEITRLLIRLHQNGVPRRRLVAEAMRHLDTGRGVRPDPRTIRRICASLNFAK